jgi:predicted glycosyltransferase involved in capsule biosynthesis
MINNEFIEGLKALQENEMVSPYYSVVDLDQQESGMDFNQILQINRPGRGENDNQKINISGGIAMFRRDAIARIGGWNEDFIGWGGEDDFQTMKVKNFLKWTELKYRCFHLYHAKEQPDMKWYQRNLQILNNSAKFTKDDLAKQINMSMPKMGMINKYDK